MWRSCRRIDQALAGHELRRAELRVPRFATTPLAGRTVLECVPRGKHQLTRLSGGLTLHSHLRMDGRWRFITPGARWPGPAHQLRVRLVTDETEALGFLLSQVELVRTEDEHRLVGHLGPDLLGPDWDADEARRRLLEHPDTTIGEALLDQRNLAGIGTMWRAESLFLEGVHPRTPVRLVPDLDAVVARAHTLLHGAIKGRTTVRRSGSDQFWAFGRDGRPCHRCGTAIRREEFGPVTMERRSFWCPRCQPEVPAAS